MVACSVAEQFVLIGATFAPQQWQSTQQNSRLSSVDGALCFNQRRHATVAAAGQRRRTNGTSGISHLTRAVHANDRLYRAGSTMGICQRTAGYLMDIGAAPTACRRGFCGGGVVVLICGNLDRRKTGVANSRRIAFCSLRARGGLAHSADGGRFAPTARPLSAGTRRRDIARYVGAAFTNRERVHTDRFEVTDKPVAMTGRAGSTRWLAVLETGTSGSLGGVYL